MIGRVLNSLDAVSLLDLALALVETGRRILRATVFSHFLGFGALGGQLQERGKQYGFEKRKRKKT